MSAETLLDDLSDKFSSGIGERIALFLVNFAEDLSLFYNAILYAGTLLGLIFFLWFLNDVKQKNVNSQQGKTSGGMLAKFIASCLMAQLAAYGNALSNSVMGTDPMTPYSYLEKVQKGSGNEWTDMLLSIMAIVTVLGWFYILKSLWLFGTLDGAQDREGQLRSAAYTALGSVIVLGIVSVIKSTAESGGVVIESLGGF